MKVKLHLEKPENLMRIAFLEPEKRDSDLIPANLLVDAFAREFKLLESLGKVLFHIDTYHKNHQGNQAEVFKVVKKQTDEILAAKIYNTRDEERVQMVNFICLSY